MRLALSPKYLVGLSFRIVSPRFKSWPEGVFHHFTQYLQMGFVILHETRPQLLSTKMLLQNMLHVFPEYIPVVQYIVSGQKVKWANNNYLLKIARVYAM
jgi:hypothetical protein